MKSYALALILALCVPFAIFATQEIPISTLPAETIDGVALPKAWASDELYVIECWATWCGPCIKAIPHMERLYQELKDEQFQFYGMNVSDNRDADSIRTFLAKQPTPPTYPIAIDSDGKFVKLLNVSGIPFACVVKEGKVLWQGNPTKLHVNMLRALRDGKTIEKEGATPVKKPQPVKADPMMVSLEFERQADLSAAKGDWDAAIRFQREALLAHPLQKRLPAPYIPEICPLPNTRLPAATRFTDQGDAATFAQLLGKPLPVDKVMTFVSLWRYPWWLKTNMSHVIRAVLPGRAIATRFPLPHRTYTISLERDCSRTQKLLSQVPGETFDICYVKDDPKDAFNFNERQNYPFVAVFFDGELLYKGSVEALPEALQKPFTTAAEFKAAIAQESAINEAVLVDYYALRAAKDNPGEQLKILAMIEKKPLPGKWAMMLIPNFFGHAYETKNLDEALRVFNRFLARYAKDDGVLKMLNKIEESWPELSDKTQAQQIDMAESLAEVNFRDEPGYNVAWYLVAAERAQKLGDMKREQALVRKAINASSPGIRWQSLSNHHPSLPSTSR
ncbi:MAG: TlpA disulfide reductase family protein [Kiritimatiellia bacterium]